MTDQNSSTEIVSSEEFISDVTVSSIEIAPDIARDNVHVVVIEGEGGKPQKFLLDNSAGGYQGNGSLITLILAHIGGKKVDIRTTGYVYKGYGYINGVLLKPKTGSSS
ncbi:hypothetical protein [Photorhabdus tasmaniensis]|uniref:Uncharacterized protein n=1 Tax=Photorhabdus tasmaniensis TaxID=1004159 RepID=A0ABX0GPK2_9GAMM|nr:hypothetical protein [Photorhabdus tasmaniensis]NHB90142.1 hypothetical protein [Photorhabdus tasmaniensis]